MRLWVMIMNYALKRATYSTRCVQLDTGHDVVAARVGYQFASIATRCAHRFIQIYASRAARVRVRLARTEFVYPLVRTAALAVAVHSAAYSDYAACLDEKRLITLGVRAPRIAEWRAHE